MSGGGGKVRRNKRGGTDRQIKRQTDRQIDGERSNRPSVKFNNPCRQSGINGYSVLSYIIFSAIFFFNLRVLFPLTIFYAGFCYLRALFPPGLYFAWVLFSCLLKLLWA